LTCSDTAVTGTISALLDDDLALVAMAGHEQAGHEQEVSIALVTAGIGDTVLVHAGEAIGVVRR
jgi:hydrogenase maturation factor